MLSPIQLISERGVQIDVQKHIELLVLIVLTRMVCKSNKSVLSMHDPRSGQSGGVR